MLVFAFDTDFTPHTLWLRHGSIGPRHRLQPTEYWLGHRRDLRPGSFEANVKCEALARRGEPAIFMV